MAFGERDHALLAARPGRLESLPGGLVVGVVSKVSELPLLHFEHPTRRQAGKARTPGLGTECSFTDFTDPTACMIGLFAANQPRCGGVLIPRG